MKKYYSFSIAIILLSFFSGCSKDFLKSYEDRIEGTWNLSDVDRVGFGGNTSNVTFSDGRFIFQSNGQLQYISTSGMLYKGSWDLDRQTITDGCSTNNNGDRDCQTRQVRTLFITAVDFTNQEIRTEHFDEVHFTSTNRFKAWIHSGAHSYVFYFERQ